MGRLVVAAAAPPPLTTTADTTTIAAAAPLANASTLPTDAVHVDNQGTLHHAFNLMPRSKRPQPTSAASAPSLSLSALAAGLELTPPSSPFRPQFTRALASADVVAVTVKTLSMEDAGTEDAEPESMRVEAAEAKAAIPAHVEEEQQLTWKTTVPRPYPKTYELLGFASSGFEEYGRGAWSTVYCAIETRDTSFTTAPLTPPSSPPSSSVGSPGIHGLLAVKRPSRHDAHRILDEEARILTYLQSFPNAHSYLVPFHGYDQSTHSLVFSAVPLSLEAHVKSAARAARADFSTATMFDPVLGVTEWAHLARRSIQGLAFLHAAHCVHGDVKPANILLHPSSSGTLTPLFCDFSSSRVVTTDGEDSPEITAVTTEYTAPELLSALHRRTPSARAMATPAADVFALAVTLLVAATGESAYAAARMEVQKLAMAKEGIPLAFARGGEAASRVMPGRMVDRVVRVGAEKDVDRRVSAEEWMRVVMEVLGGEETEVER